MLQPTRLLQKEQASLYSIEKKLVKALSFVQETMNSLKVEELHLKSQSLDQTMSSETLPSSSNIDVAGVSFAQSITTPNEQINRQEIDLGLSANKLEQFDVENDSD